MIFNEETATPKERRNYRKGQDAYYEGTTWDELTGIKTSEREKEYLQGWQDAQEEERLNKQ